MIVIVEGYIQVGLSPPLPARSLHLWLSLDPADMRDIRRGENHLPTGRRTHYRNSSLLDSNTRYHHRAHAR